MLIVTTDSVPGWEIDALGLVRGTTMKSIGLRIIWTMAHQQAQEEALAQMTVQAQEREADAVVGLRLESLVIGVNVAVTAYGTAIRRKR